MKVVGYWWDEFRYPDGGVLLTERRKNTFTVSGRVLVAALMARVLVPETLTGISYHAFGNGDAGWGGSPPAPAGTEVALEAEFCRYAPTNVSYESPSGSVSVGARTSAVKFETIIPAGAHDSEVVREHGLFGGDATGTVDSGWMVNVIRHAPITIPVSTELRRFIQLEF